MGTATLGVVDNFVSTHDAEEDARVALAAEIERRGGEERERPLKCWAVFRGRDGFTGVVDSVTEHNLKVIRASGVRSRKFRYRSHAVDWLAE